LDNVTHTLFAATLARTPLGSAGRGTTAALVLASNIPDIDIVSAVGGAAGYLRWHRGPTHGPLGVVGLGLLTAAIVWSWMRWVARLNRLRQGSGAREPRAPVNDAASDGTTDGAAPASFGMLVAVSMIGVLLHILMDLPTSYGTRLLSPFDWHWYGLDWLPIVDVYLLVALAAGLIFGGRTADARRRNAAIVLALMAANYGARGIAHHQALSLAPRLFGPTLPPPCDDDPQTAMVDRWPRDAAPTPPPSGNRCLVEIAVMPTFTTPFEWRIVAQMSNAYEVHGIDLLDARFTQPPRVSTAFWRQTTRYPNIWTPLVERAAATRLGRVFLGFSRFPAARSFVDTNGVATIRWTDMRFVAGLIAVEQPIRRATPFSAVVRIGADGRILEESLSR
jgi:membrane-bound metal-dependent hydrolase YbcI (DUF457 family)